MGGLFLYCCSRVLRQSGVLGNATGPFLVQLAKMFDHWNGVCAPMDDVRIFNNNKIFGVQLKKGPVLTDAISPSLLDNDFGHKLIFAKSPTSRRHTNVNDNFPRQKYYTSLWSAECSHCIPNSSINVAD